MIDINKAFTIVFNGTQSILEKAGFSAALPDGYKKGDLPLNTEDNITYMQFSNGETLLSMQLDEIKKTFSLFTADAPQDAVDDPEFQSLSTWGFDIKEADDRDANSVANDFCDIIRTKYAPDAVSASDTRVKMPQTISKKSAKNGDGVYDAKMLATRFATVFPEYKDAVKENISKYGDLLPETFFSTYAAPRVISVIKSKDAQLLKKLFTMFNEVHEDGCTEVQEIITVTILGEIHNDETMMNTIDSYMSDLLRRDVVAVNKLLSGSSGKKWIEKLKNPPAYKPPKVQNYAPPTDLRS